MATMIVTIVHGEMDTDTTERISALAFLLRPWWVRTHGTNDTTTYHLSDSVRLDYLIDCIVDNAEWYWRAVIEYHGTTLCIPRAKAPVELN